MKRSISVCMLLLLLFLHGCKTASDVSQTVSEMYQHPIEATVQISTLSGVACDYHIDCTVGLTESTVCVVKPENLKGLKAIIQSNTCSIQYEDLILDSLMVPVRGMTPMDCFDQTVFALRSEIPTNYGYEKKSGTESLCLTYQGEVSGYEYTRILWLDEQTLKILEGEYYLDGVLVMRMVIDNLTITEASAIE